MYVYDARTYSLYKCTLLKRCLAARAASRRSVLCLRCVHVLYRRKDLWLCVCIYMYTCFRIASAGFSRSRPLPGLRGNGIKCSSFALSCTIIRAPTGCAFIFREKPLDFIRLARGNMQQRVLSLCNNRLLSLLSLSHSFSPWQKKFIVLVCAYLHGRLRWMFIEKQALHYCYLYI